MKSPYPYTRLSPSLEDYLKTILQGGPAITVSVIAARLNVSKASAVEAVHKLCALGLTTHRRYGPVSLTPRGLTVARNIVARHRAFTAWLTTALGVPRPLAERDACVLEHGLSPETTTRLLHYAAGLARFTSPARPGPEKHD